MIIINSTNWHESQKQIQLKNNKSAIKLIPVLLISNYDTKRIDEEDFLKDTFVN